MSAEWATAWLTLVSAGVVLFVGAWAIRSAERTSERTITHAQKIATEATESQRNLEWTRLRIEAFARFYVALRLADVRNSEFEPRWSDPVGPASGVVFSDAKNAATAAEQAAILAGEELAILLPQYEVEIGRVARLIEMGKTSREDALAYVARRSSRQADIEGFRSQMIAAFRVGT
jgi:ABC-type nickel/cobalt efflux system permease component RcnA